MKIEQPRFPHTVSLQAAKIGMYEISRWHRNSYNGPASGMARTRCPGFGVFAKPGTEERGEVDPPMAYQARRQSRLRGQKVTPRTKQFIYIWPMGQGLRLCDP